MCSEAPMTERTENRISDETLGAYLDGELDSDAARRLEARLELDPSARRRLEALRRVSTGVGASLRRARGAAAHAASAEDADPLHMGARVIPLPGARAAGRRTAARRASFRGILWGTAAGFAAGVVFAAAILIPFGKAPRHASGWEDHALAFHESYLESLGGDHAFPLDARTSDPVALGQSLGEIVGWDLEVPDLTDRGYTLQGARLITTAQGPVAYLLYSSEDEPLLGVALLQSSAAPRGETLHEHGDLHLLEWSDGRNSFGLGGTHSPDLLRSLAAAVQSSDRSFPDPGAADDIELQ
jgi:anti-sigma factor RsiW